MNQFVSKFGTAIDGFYRTSDEENNKLLADILAYANTNPASFKNDFREVRFDDELEPLPIVFEALSTDTDNWGQFYLDTVNDIFDTAKAAEEPQPILDNLGELGFIEDDDRPFIQQIADRIYKEIDADNLAIQLAAIWTLPGFLTNDV